MHVPVYLFVILLGSFTWMKEAEAASKSWHTRACDGYCFNYNPRGCADCCVDGRLHGDMSRFGDCDQYKRCLCYTAEILKAQQGRGGLEGFNNNYYKNNNFGK